MQDKFDAIIVGGGIAGIYALYKMRGLGLSTKVFEAGTNVGGTWYWNRYPGARCDGDSMDYSYSFDNKLQQDWDWPERFSMQPDIEKYLQHVVDRFGMRGDFQFSTTVTSTHYDEGQKLWRVQAGGKEHLARYLILATGFLSTPTTPNIPGLDKFKGPVYTTSRWPKERVSFKGKRVGQIGTGSSGIQVVPVVAKEADKLTVFQRTANYAVPAQNRRIAGSPETADFKARYPEIRAKERRSSFGAYWSAFEVNEKSALAVTPEEREKEYEWRWTTGGATFMASFADLLTNLEANRTAADFIRGKIKKLVKNPETARKLMPPEDNPVACRRLCVEVGYYDAFNRDNVDLVNLREDPIVAVEANGIRTKSGFHEVDALILATGFDAMTGSFARIDVRGRGGAKLTDAWKDGPRNYLGVLTSGFPNMMVMNGPLSAAGNFVTCSEVVGDWIANLIQHAETNKIREIDALPEAEEEWVKTTKVMADSVVAFQARTCSAWYARNRPDGGRDILLYIGGLADFEDRWTDAAKAGYRGIELRA